MNPPLVSTIVSSGRVQLYKKLFSREGAGAAQTLWSGEIAVIISLVCVYFIVSSNTREYVLDTYD